MPTSTEVLISKTTLASATNNIIISGIPQTYTDLRIILSGGQTSGGGSAFFRLNNDTNQRYSQTQLRGNGASVQRDRETNVSQLYFYSAIQGAWAAPSPNRGLFTLDILSYSNTSINKTLLFEVSDNQNGSGRIAKSVGLYRNTSGVESIWFTTDSPGDSYVVGTTITIYGIL